jgi:pilus assembly protein CpaB
MWSLFPRAELTAQGQKGGAGRVASSNILKMNKRLLTILLLAFVIAGACAFLVFRVIGNRLGAPAISTTKVVAAAGDIKLGTVLAKDKNSLIGRGVISDLYQGEPILDSRLAPVGLGGGLAATIPDGMRAMSVKVDDVVGVSGFATPGMHVDVLASVPIRVLNNQAQQENTIVKTILQNIEVLSAGVNIQKDAEGKPQQVQVVNLLLTPDQAETLSLASTGANGTRIQLVLRNPLDTQTKDVQENSVGNIFGDPNVPVKARLVAHSVKKPGNGHVSVEILNGATRTEEKFSSPEAKQ